MKKNKIVILLALLTLFSCGISKRAKALDKEFNKYLKIVNIDRDTITDFKNFLAYEDSIKKQKLRDSPYLKINEVYVYYRYNDLVTFSVFDDEGHEYVSSQRVGGDLLEQPKNDIVKLKGKIILPFFGWYDLKKNSIRKKRNHKTPFKEWGEVAKGLIRNDTICFTENYRTKEFGFEKKWLAKTRKINSKIVHQPNLKAVKTKIFRFGSEIDVFVISGNFFMKEDKTVVKW